MGRDEQEHAGLIVSAWMKSPGHRANILEPEYREIGIGMAYEAPEAQPVPKQAAIYTDDVRRGRALADALTRYPLGMLEVADLARRYGDVVALDGLVVHRRARAAVRLRRPQRGRQDDDDADHPRRARARRGLGALARARRSTCATRAPLRLHAGGARAVPEDAGARPARLLRLAARRCARADALAATDGWLERLGIADRAGDRVEALSLGNQQRVQLGAALVHDPELLVLDEPFSGLDPVGVDVLSGVLRELADGGVPVLFSSHQLELVERLCESVAIVKDGRLVASGRVDELRAARRRARRPCGWRSQGGGEDWLAAVPGAEVVDRGAGRRAGRAARRRRARGGARRGARRRDRSRTSRSSARR